MDAQSDTGYLRLGVNIDHVATIRNARGGAHPDPVRAAHLAAEAGADGITAHLREDRRHISDRDIEQLRADITLPLNLEMAATAEMLDIALRHVPNACCLVPEKREELTTEGGLDVRGGHNKLTPYVRQLKEAGIRVSLFVDPDAEQLNASSALAADIVELHAGAYCEKSIEGDLTGAEAELERLRESADLAHSLGLEVHAGHGITFDTVKPIAAMDSVVELNIGHFLIGDAIFVGLENSIRRMRELMDAARVS